MDLYVFDFDFLIFFMDGSRSNECAYGSDFLKCDFYFFYVHVNFCLCILYF
jgi:hypothetical protein